MCLQVIKSARVMKKAVGYLIPFMEKEREEMMSESSQDLVSLSHVWGNVAKTRVPSSGSARFSFPRILQGWGWMLKNTN